MLLIAATFHIVPVIRGVVQVGQSRKVASRHPFSLRPFI